MLTVQQRLAILTPTACAWFPSVWRERDRLLALNGERPGDDWHRPSGW